MSHSIHILSIQIDDTKSLELVTTSNCPSLHAIQNVRLIDAVRLLEYLLMDENI